MAPELKGIPVSPLTGVLDARSNPDALPQGSVRYRQNYQTVAQNTLRRGSGWTKLFSTTPYNNSDFHDQLLALSGAMRQPVTLLFEANSTRGVRSLFAATQATIAQLNQNDGNWRIIGSGYGGDPVATGTARRFKCAQVGDYIAFTNDFERPVYHVLEQSPADGGALLNRFTDFDLIGLTRAKVVWAWHNCLFFADVEMDGDRIAYRLLWSNFKDPTSFDPAKLDSITGSKDLFDNEQILGGLPGLGNTFIIFTTQGMWEMSVTGNESSFGFRRIYNGEENKGVAVLKYPNTLVAVTNGQIYAAEDGIYLFNQYSGQPKRIEWLHRSTSLLYDTLDKSACDSHVAAMVNDEMLISVARIGAPNQLPDITLRVNMSYDVADIIDHGFSAFCGYRSYDVPTIRDFIIQNGICTLEALQDAGYGYGNEGLPSPLPDSTAPFQPLSVYTLTPQVIGTGDALGSAKTVVEVSRSSNVATAKVVAHGYSTSDRVQIEGISDPSFNNPNATITVVDVDHITYPNKGPDLTTTAAAVPFVRKLGAPVQATAIVLVDGTVTVKMNAHGFSTGQKVRVSPRFGGNPSVFTALVSITVADVDTFTYPSGAKVTDTQYGMADIVNAIPAHTPYDWTTGGTPHYDNAQGLVSGLIYFYVPGLNELKLHLVGPNTDLSSTSSFTYDGGGIDLIGVDNSTFKFNYIYNSATSAPPAAGALRFNNATIPSATHLYVQRQDNDGFDNSQKLRNVQVNDILRVQKHGDPTIFHTIKVTNIGKHNAYYDFTFTYVTGAGTLVDTDPVDFSSIPTSETGKLITASISTGLKVLVSTVGPVLTPTLVSRNDPDNVDVVTMTLTAHGLLTNDLIWVGGISDTGFNAFSTPVVRIVNLAHPTFSVTDANHFTYVREGNLTDSKSVSAPTARKLTNTNTSVEDWTRTNADSDSLCALLGNERLDDICRTCSGATLFVSASTQDLCLKQMGGVFYRERCANPTATGTTNDDGYTSSAGSYILDGYDSILRFAPMFTTAPGQPYVQLSEFKMFYQDVGQQPPSTIGLRVGVSGQPKDPNITGCGMIWYQHSQKPITCLSNKTEAQHKATNTQPNQYAKWNLWREGRYLAIETTISGTNGDVTFTSVVADVTVKEAENI